MAIAIVFLFTVNKRSIVGNSKRWNIEYLNRISLQISYDFGLRFYHIFKAISETNKNSAGNRVKCHHACYTHLHTKIDARSIKTCKPNFTCGSLFEFENAFCSRNLNSRVLSHKAFTQKKQTKTIILTTNKSMHKSSIFKQT